MKLFITRYLLILLSIILFSLGNIVYSEYVNVPWYVRSILSEFLFVFMYTIVDYGNLKYKYKFAIPHIVILIIFYTPLFRFLFYSTNVQIFSVSISIIAILINVKVLNILFNKGFARIFCSRTGTTVASLVEILLFSLLLDLGIKGAVLMAILRPIYIAIVPKFVFRK